MDKKIIGNIGENAVCLYLKNKGCEIVKRNFTVRGGEIDIIATKDKRLFFVEVKTRMKNPLVSGEKAITQRKKEHIIKTARMYLSTLDYIPICRFDVAVVTLDDGRVTEIKYYPNAFDASR